MEEETPGQRIIRLRLANDWDQARLAHVVGVAQTTVSTWETDKNKPSRDSLYRLARALAVDVDDLGYEPPPANQPPRPVPPTWFEEWAEENAAMLGVIQKQLLRIESLLTDHQNQGVSASVQAEGQHQ